MMNISAEAKGERWLWIELLGFELTAPDYGVGALFERTGFVPEGVSLLLSDPEFVHGHSEDEERILRPSICSYDGHPYNEERSLQVWRARDVKGLVTTLQRHGAKVFFTHFDAPVDGWAEGNPELLYTSRKGERFGYICPYKRFASGVYYREFYHAKVLAAVRDYGFDGLHAGDGYAHPRVPIYEGDFSDDTVAQYLEWSGDALPEHVALLADGETSEVGKRADWIWRERRAQWIAFQRARTVTFWGGLSELLHAEGRLLYMNSCWTRDPFEALYRYGVDYRALSEAGVDGFVAEVAAAAQEYGGDLPYLEDGFDQWEPGRVLSRFATKLLLLRAAAPDAKIIFMNGIKDTNEAWSGLRHAPVNLESEILLYKGLFRVGREGALLPASDGLLATLSDSLWAEDWRWLRERWALGDTLRPARILGAAIYWSDAYLAALTDDYIATRRTPFDRIVWEMTVAGAPILATVRPEHLSDWKGTLLVVHPHLLSPAEWKELRAWGGGDIVAVGGVRSDGGGGDADYQWSESEGVDALHLSVYRSGGQGVSVPEPLTAPVQKPFDAAEAFEPFQWLEYLPSREIDPEFFKHAADWIIALTRGARVGKNRADVRVWAYDLGQGRFRVHVRNDCFYYRTALIEMPWELGGIKTLTAFPGNPVKIVGETFRFKIAGKSMAMFEVEPKVSIS